MLTSPRRLAVIVALAVCACSSSGVVFGQPLPVDPPQPAPTPLQKDADAFAAESAKLPPAQAAARWLALVDRALTADDDLARAARRWPSPQPGDNTAVVMRALPPPAAWPAIAAAVEARPRPKPVATGGRGPDPGTLRDVGLRLMAHALAGDEPALQAGAAELAKLAAAIPRDVGRPPPVGATLADVAASIAGNLDPKAYADDFRRRVDEARDGEEIFIPELVAPLGPTEAEALVRHALGVSIHLEFSDENSRGWVTGSERLEPPPPTGDATRRLSQRLATELVGRADYPQWHLVDVHAPRLFEAIDARFSQALVDEEEEQPHFRDPRARARGAYLVASILAGRTDDAARVARQLVDRHRARDGKPAAGELHVSSDASQVLWKSGSDPKAVETLLRLLGEFPQLGLWDKLFSTAARADRTADAVKLARDVMARKEVRTPLRRAIAERLYAALLADDQLEPTVGLLRQLMAEAVTEEDLRESGLPVTTNPTLDRAGRALSLAEVGRLTGRREWVDEGLAAARAAHRESLATLPWMYDSQAVDLSKELIDAGRGDEAIAVLVATLEAGRRATDAERKAAKERGTDFREDRLRDVLLGLASAYHRAGRHADIVALFERAPDWGDADAVTFFEHWAPGDISVGYLIASALYGVGRAAEGRAVADALIDARPGYDPAYEVMVNHGIAPDGADTAGVVARLDALFARDRFEERPLIWKAEVLRRQRKLDDAERVVREAITVDPSDGESGHGIRMRAYAVLADVLRDRGDAKQEATYRGVVAAIRASEDADRLSWAGLDKRATALYRKSLDLFADAYCIQSRLAIHYADQGRWDLAERHYRRAYELMPDSFGGVESHCFGCEGVFKGGKTPEIAEAVFAKLVAERPDDAKVHYLLAYLRDQQGRPAEALPLLKRAVVLDGDYLKAWVNLVRLDGKPGVTLSPADRDAAALAILRLDPLGRHAEHSSAIAGVRDLRGLWRAAEAAYPIRPKAPHELFPLPASAAELKRHGRGDGADGAVPRLTVRAWFSQMPDEDRSPAALFVGTRRIAAAIQLMNWDATEMRAQR